MSNDGRDREKRDIALAPGSHAYMQDTTKGTIKVYVGPTVINQTAQEVPVVWNPAAGKFDKCATLEDAVRLNPVAAEGSYLILDNPSKDGKHPTDGAPTSAPDLDTGRKIIIPGPCSFALWPGQAAAVVQGHQLRSNEYLLVRVYNEEEARKNWTSAVMKPASGDTPATPVVKVPADLTVGKLFIIRGTEVSFYIPPTGVTVVPDGAEGFVRDALTLEKLEYAILVDEDGNKRYEKGPQVVFPKPTEAFRKDEKGNVKFRAIELNEIQGLHIKVISAYIDEGGREHKEGEELFITGKDTQIYFPREEHSLIKYDGKVKHFATAIPAGEGRYVMDRMTGEIRMVKGPAMLLPDPRHEVIVRRALSDNQSNLWYPGNTESLEYNRVLRNIQLQAPTTRAGAISEGDFERGAKKGLARSKAAPVAVAAASYVSNAALMEASLVSGDQNHVGDEFSRASTYSQPRTVTLNTKFEGVPSIDVWTGYAVMVVSKSGKRRVEKGPGTVLLGYDESLEVLELSTGKPKTTDNLLKTVYLRITNNKVSDKVAVETNDHVGIELSMSFRVNFEGEEPRWFEADNYVKLLCDHIRSVLKGAIKKTKVEGFYINAVDIIRDLILGEKDETGKRPGMFFADNGMRVTDVEVLGVKILDERIHKMLNEAQHEVVRSNIELSNARRDLAVTQEKEGIARQVAETKAATAAAQHKLETQLVASQLDLFMAKVASTLRQHEENRKAAAAQQDIQDLMFDKDLARQKRLADQQAAIAKEEQERRLEALRAEVQGTIDRFKAAQGGFSEALLALSHEETVVKVAEALSVQNFLGGKNFSEVVQKVFAGTPLQHLLDRVVSKGNNGHSVTEEGARAQIQQ